MQRDDFQSKVESLQKRLRQQQRGLPPKSQKILNEALADLQNLTEELSESYRRLTAQNSEFAKERLITEEEKKRYQNLFNLAPDGYLVTDRQTQILEANQAAVALLDIDRESLIGRPLALYVTKENLKEFLSNAVQAAHGGTPRKFEMRLRGGGKKTADVLVTVSANSRGGSMRWLIRDVTEHKEIEERMRNSERLATMGATATLLVQEISNPLNSMFTTIHRLQRDLDSPAALRSIALDLKDETSRLRGLLEKFLSFSRPASVNFTTIEVRLLLTDLLSPLGAVHTQRGIQIDYVSTGPLFIKADQQRLKQALFNVCINGIEAMPQGGKLTVNASPSDERVVIRIIDTGSGVSQGIDIFDLFTTTKFQAMGMGLPIARQIVLDHRGTISYSSEPGNTTFRIDLPAVEP